MKDKICLICHTNIDTSKEFCEFKTYKNKNEILSKAFYHVECFRERLRGSKTQKELAEKAFSLLEKAGVKI